MASTDVNVQKDQKQKFFNYRNNILNKMYGERYSGEELISDGIMEELYSERPTTRDELMQIEGFESDSKLLMHYGIEIIHWFLTNSPEDTTAVELKNSSLFSENTQ